MTNPSTTTPFAIPEQLPPPQPLPTTEYPIDTSRIFPEGIWRNLYHKIQPLIEGHFQFPLLWKQYEFAQRRSHSPKSFSNLLLWRLGNTCQVEDLVLKVLESMDGPAMVAFNHPFGGAEALAMVSVLETARPGGWTMMANRALCAIPVFQEVFLEVDPMNAQQNAASVNRKGLARTLRHLRNGNLVGLLPAGKVSHRDAETGAITDRPWSDHAVRLTASAEASIVVLHIPGSNSNQFLNIPAPLRLVRAMSLCKELVHPAQPNLQIELAKHLKPSEVKSLAKKQNPGPKLQSWCHLRAAGILQSPNPPVEVPKTSIEPSANPSKSTLDVSEFELFQTETYELLFFQGKACPKLLEELGRARERTFRAAGQGTGREIDINPEDEYYHHLVLRDKTTKTITGAYRIGIIQKIIQEQGHQDLYLDHVFQIDPLFYKELGGALELSRSFVSPDRQKDNQALAMLWKGLGKVALNWNAMTLFGSVTISNEHHPASQAILVDFLQNNYADSAHMRSLVKAKIPFAPQTQHHTYISNAYKGEGIASLTPLIHHLENGARGIPPLMRYYCSLGAKFLAYHVEPTFANALYCLLRVQLDQIPEGFKKRFLQ